MVFGLYGSDVVANHRYVDLVEQKDEKEAEEIPPHESFPKAGLGDICLLSTIAFLEIPFQRILGQMKSMPKRYDFLELATVWLDLRKFR